MAKYFLRVKIISRAKGSRATKAAAYRAGERIADERTGDAYDFSDREDVADKEVVFPSDLADRSDMAWARDRARLWNAAEHAGRLRNSRLAREVLVILPPELSKAQRRDLVRGFSQELANKYRNAVDFAVHEPRAGSDERHHHAHILMTTRQISPQGLGARTTLDLSGSERHGLGLGNSREDLLFIRERWAHVTNEALKSAGLTARVDHRSYQAQGIDQEPQPVMPQKIYYRERLTGTAHPLGDQIRAEHLERVVARGQGGDALARVLDKQREAARRGAIGQAQVKAALPRVIARGALTRDQLNEKRREYCKANSDRINRVQRERRNAQRDETNRKQREYLQKRSVAAKAAKTAASPGKQTQTSRQAPSADESVKNWLAYRESQSQASSEETLQRWHAYRARENDSAASAKMPEDRSRPAEAHASDRDDPHPRKTSKRSHDAGL